MAQIKTSELPTAESLDYAVGIKDGVTSKAPISSGVNCSSTEHIVGKWFGETLYEKTLIIDTSSFTKGQDNDIDISSLGAKMVFLDFNKSFEYYTEDGLYATTPIAFSNSSSTNVINKAYLKYISYVYTSAIGYYIGSSVQINDTLYLTIQYTK